MKILRGISTVYDKLLNGLATASTELQFDFSKIQSNPFSEEVTQFILNNSILPNMELYKQYYTTGSNTIKFSLPMILNLKTNLKNSPSTKSIKYI